VKAGAHRLVILTDPRSAAAEAYRALRINLQYGSLDRPLRTLLVTSATAEEGKTAALCNLAVSFAQAGTSVVVADCDLRRPSVHQVFDLANDKGLTTMLLEDEPDEVPLQQTAVPGLRVLTTGPVPANPADLLSARRTRRAVDALSGAADLVLFDAAPVGLVAETAVLASQMDGVLLVVSAGKTRREAAVRARSLLERTNARVLGVVLNNAQPNSKLHSY
jgi:capsular exopolysaccharide synthesis family protein